MKKLFFQSLLFLLPVSAVVFLNLKTYRTFTDVEFGPGTAQQIHHSFKMALERKYDCLALGNSRIYRNLNPDKISIPTYNFAHDDGTVNQFYFKQQYLEKHGVQYKYFILGVDYFQFSFFSDSRNYLYNKYFDPAYQKDYQGNSSDTPFKKFLWSRSYFKSINDSFNRFVQINFSQTVLSVFKYMVKKIRGQQLRPKTFMRDNGQYVVTFSFAMENDFIERSAQRLPGQEHYFDEILKFAKDRKIKVFMVLPPTRQNELAAYSKETIQEFDAYFKSKADNKTVFFLDYSTHPDFEFKDYADITHLIEEGADKFSIILNRDLMKIISDNPDYI